MPFSKLYLTRMFCARFGQLESGDDFLRAGSKHMVDHENRLDETDDTLASFVIVLVPEPELFKSASLEIDHPAHGSSELL